MIHPEGILHDFLIQDRASCFQGIFHGCTVYLAENITRQIGIHVQKHPADLPV